MRNELEEQIARIGDLERLISRVSVGRIVPREVVQLKNALIRYPAGQGDLLSVG